MDSHNKPLLLIVDDDEHISRLISLVLKRHGYACITACSGSQAISKFAAHAVDLVITDLNMPWGDGITLIQAIRRTSNVPVITISALAGEYIEKIRLLDGVSILPKPLNLENLEKSVRLACPPPAKQNVMAPRISEEMFHLPKEAHMYQPSVLIADDDIGLVRLLRTVLESMGAQVRSTHDAISALMKIHESPPDLVILDVNMPAGNGLSVCEMLVTDTGLSRVPVIVLTGEAGHARVRSVAMGAHYVQKGPEAMSEIRQLAGQILLEAKTTKSQLFIG